ncbi:tetratricopeptide repeat-containing sensor histidine kinase [Algoriphagus namhaensis]
MNKSPFWLLFSLVFIIFCQKNLIAQVSRVDSLNAVLEKEGLSDSIRVLLLIDLCEASTFTEEQGGKDYALQALALSKTIPFQVGEALANNSLGAYYIQVGDVSKALGHILEAERIYRELGNQESRLLAVYNNLGIVYNRSGDWSKAIDVYKKAIESAEKEGIPQQKAMLFNNLGSAYDNLGLYDSAVLAFEKVEQVSREADLELGIMMAKSNLGSVYHSMGQNAQAAEAYGEALIISQRGNYTRNTATILIGLGDAYAGLEKWKLAEEYFQKGLAIAEEIQSWPLLEDGFAGLAEVYELRKDYPRALDAFKNLQVVRDSLFSLEKSETVEELKMRFETEQQEAEIVNLSQQNQIQTLEIQRKNQLVILLVLVFLVITGAGWSFYQRKKLKAEKENSNLEQRFLRSQLNPHFIFNALSTVQNYMLKAEGRKAAYFLGKFAKLMRQVLENSRTEFIPLQEEIRMMENYLELEQMLSQKDFSFEIFVDNNLDPESIAIPPMFVQPFLENAIKHGLRNEDGIIRIRFGLDGHLVRIAIEDNGQGINNQQIQQAHRSLSTSIIRERIENYNRKLDTPIQLQILPAQEGKQEPGTLVRLSVPYVSTISA